MLQLIIQGKINGQKNAGRKKNLWAEESAILVRRFRASTDKVKTFMLIGRRGRKKPSSVYSIMWLLFVIDISAVDGRLALVQELTCIWGSIISDYS